MHGQKRLFWQLPVPFRVVYCADFSNTGQQNRATWKDMTDISNFRVWDHVAGTCFNLGFPNKLLIDSRCSISKSQSRLRSWFQMAFGIRDLNWQVRMCCEVPLRLCVYNIVTNMYGLEYFIRCLRKSMECIIYNTSFWHNLPWSSCHENQECLLFLLRNPKKILDSWQE